MQQSKCITEECDIVIGMIQSIVVRDEWKRKKIYSQFGFVVFDECHHVCARTFKKAVLDRLDQ